MGRQPLPPAPGVSVLAALAAYAHHDDPATRLANRVALLVGSNGPFYPLYVWWIVPEAGVVALATMLASPFFLAIPWLSRRCAWLGRAALPAVGLANTAWTGLLLGPATGVEAFAYPCLVLAGLAWRERWLMLGLLGAGLATQQLVAAWTFAPLSGLAPAMQAQLVALHGFSAAALLSFVVLAAAGLDDPRNRGVAKAP